MPFSGIYNRMRVIDEKTIITTKKIFIGGSSMHKMPDPSRYPVELNNRQLFSV